MALRRPGGAAQAVGLLHGQVRLPLRPARLEPGPWLGVEGKKILCHVTVTPSSTATSALFLLHFVGRKCRLRCRLRHSLGTRGVDLLSSSDLCVNLAELLLLTRKAIFSSSRPCSTTTGLGDTSCCFCSHKTFFPWLQSFLNLCSLERVMKSLLWWQIASQC